MFDYWVYGGVGGTEWSLRGMWWFIQVDGGGLTGRRRAIGLASILHHQAATGSLLRWRMRWGFVCDLSAIARLDSITRFARFQNSGSCSCSFLGAAQAVWSPSRKNHFERERWNRRACRMQLQRFCWSAIFFNHLIHQESKSNLPEGIHSRSISFISVALVSPTVVNCLVEVTWTFGRRSWAAKRMDMRRPW